MPSHELEPACRIDTTSKMSCGVERAPAYPDSKGTTPEKKFNQIAAKITGFKTLAESKKLNAKQTEAIQPLIDKWEKLTAKYKEILGEKGTSNKIVLGLILGQLEKFEKKLKVMEETLGKIDAELAAKPEVQKPLAQKTEKSLDKNPQILKNAQTLLAETVLDEKYRAEQLQGDNKIYFIEKKTGSIAAAVSLPASKIINDYTKVTISVPYTFDAKTGKPIRWGDLTVKYKDLQKLLKNKSIPGVYEEIGKAFLKEEEREKYDRSVIGEDPNLLNGVETLFNNKVKQKRAELPSDQHIFTANFASFASRKKLQQFKNQDEFAGASGHQILVKADEENAHYRCKGLGELEIHDKARNHRGYLYFRPHMKQLLNDIAIKLNEELHKRGLPERYQARILITSLTRDKRYNSKLSNSDTNSAHTYGVALDISMTRFDIIDINNRTYYEMYSYKKGEKEHDNHPSRALDDKLHFTQTAKAALTRVIKKMLDDGKIDVLNENDHLHIVDRDFDKKVE